MLIPVFNSIIRCKRGVLQVVLLAMAVALTILGSGSGGNCAYLETGGERLLIDAGFSGKQIRQRLASIGRSPETLTGIVLTHEHSDHILGLKGLCSKLKLPIYTNRLTREAVLERIQIQADWKVFNTGCTFELGDIEIDTFSIPHDAYDPVGFMIRTASGNIGFLTDLGHTTRLVLERVKLSNVLVLETNYDLKLLQEDVKRPWATKQRIISRHGHLSNEAAAEAVCQIVSADLKHLYLGHLSRDCNEPELARATVARELQKIGAHHVQLENTSQKVPCPTLVLG